MRRLFSTLGVAVIGGAIALGSYQLFFEKEDIAITEALPTLPVTKTTTYTSSALAAAEEINFTTAANKTVNAVVHVKNVAFSKQPRSWMEYMNGGGELRKALRGAGSGVIISPDGYIVTNNHVIKGAAEVDITLNNNKTYKAEIIGRDAAADIALLKIDAEDLAYITFGDSNNIQIGEWVLAVGNPFNLTSTVTAGIISAKARDLDPTDAINQSFLQTDAAVNPGNSGGALVNVNGELVGINTAISSQDGSYIGYSFAVPSNNVRKIVEDIMEYGDVQNAILGIKGGSLNAMLAENEGLHDTQGIYIGEVTAGSGAAKAGLKEGDIIKQIDGIKMRKFSDLTGYLGAKKPNETVEVVAKRDGKEKTFNVTLTRYITFKIDEVGLEVTDISKEELKRLKVKSGVKIIRALTQDMQRQNLTGIIITKIDNKEVSSVADVKEIVNQRDPNDPIRITFAGKDGETETYVFR
ncbi:Do family serine endopeptidase [Gangjinia marincola]|uniref:Do family serine endopeptidase n=1 Tax=Gangjinia marincola TaxID=578463 RepID=A0ABP3XUF3_9FLAO